MNLDKFKLSLVILNSVSASQISKLTNICPLTGAPGYSLHSCHFGTGGLKPLKFLDAGSSSGKLSYFCE